MADLRTFLLIVVFSFQLAITSAQPIMLYNFSCLDKLVHSQSHMYQDNLARLLRNLNSTDSMFNNSTMGESPDQVYGLYLCRGDVTEKICRSCVDNATSTIVNNCPSSASALIFYDNCMLRYSNASFFGKFDEWPIVYMYDIYNITGTSVGSFEGVVNDTLYNISMKAAMGDRLGQKFSTMETNYTEDNRTLYALGQCTPDLSSGNCYTCLADCIARLPSCCGGKRGGRVLFPSCNIRYEIYPFYANAAAPPPPLAAPHGPPPAIVKKKRSTATVIGATVATVGFVLLFAMAVVYFRRRKAKNRTDASYFKLVDIASLVAESLEYDLSTLQAATNNFSDKNKIGKGGFGVVYKGILENGDEIAVKRLSSGSDHRVEEFKNEVVLVAKLQHRNLVRLLGFCLAGEEKLLVYEFVPNKSLNYILFGMCSPQSNNLSNESIIEKLSL